MGQLRRQLTYLCSKLRPFLVVIVSQSWFCFVLFFSPASLVVKVASSFFLRGVLSQNFSEQNSHKLRARASKSHKMSNAANTKTKTQIATNEEKTQTKKKENWAREGTKSATKFLFAGKNYASPRLSHARTRATSEFEVSLRKCDQFVVIAAMVNALSTGALPHSPVLPLHPWLLLPGAVAVGARSCGQHCGRYARVGLQNWQPSDSSRGLKKRTTHTKAHTHTGRHTHRKREKNGKVNYDLWSRGKRKWP